MGGINSKEVEERMWAGGDSRKPTAKKTEEKKTSTKKPEEYNTGQELEVNENEDSSENYDPETAGPIFPDGNINWDCPCLGGAAYGPCGTEFRQAFSCFHFSKAEPKGTDCFPNFRDMHTCFSNYPDLYGSKEGEEDEDEEDELFDDEELEVIDKENEEKVKTKGHEEKEKDSDKTPKKSSEPTPAPAPPTPTPERKEIEGKPKDKEQVIPRGAAVL